MDPRLCGQSPDVEKGRAYPWTVAKLESGESSDTITTQDQRYPKAAAVTLEIRVLLVVRSNGMILGSRTNPNPRTL
jgi:hypothetical protein